MGAWVCVTQGHLEERENHPLVPGGKDVRLRAPAPSIHPVCDADEETQIIMTSFSDLFKLGKEVLKTETFVLHEAETRGVDEGVCV